MSEHCIVVKFTNTADLAFYY